MIHNDKVPAGFALPTQLGPGVFPHLWTASPAHTFSYVAVPDEPRGAAEFAHIRVGTFGRDEHESQADLLLAIMQWNAAWEAGRFRAEMFDMAALPAPLAWLAGAVERNVRLVPSFDAGRSHAYAPLYHLLPLATTERFGLPALRKGVWPQDFPGAGYSSVPDFTERLSRGFAHHIWQFLDSGSRISSYAPTEPVRLLAHDLDFWLPHVDAVAESRVRTFGRVTAADPNTADRVRRAREEAPQGIRIERPLKGGSIWMGEEEALEATREVVESADQSGRLRGIIEAIRAHRVEDDFSDRWSYAKEDFERKLYRKRAKTRVTFVQLDETIPVHGPDSEVHAELLFGNLLAILDAKERHIVVLLRSGYTHLGDIASVLGYANHSPVSKALTRIRRTAARLLERG